MNRDNLINEILDSQLLKIRDLSENHRLRPDIISDLERLVKIHKINAGELPPFDGGTRDGAVSLSQMIDIAKALREVEAAKKPSDS